MSLHVTVLKIEVHGVKSWCVQSLLEIREVGGGREKGETKAQTTKNNPKSHNPARGRELIYLCQNLRQN